MATLGSVFKEETHKLIILFYKNNWFVIKVPLVSGLIVSVVPHDDSLETTIWGLTRCQSFKLWLDAVACRLFFLEP